MSATHTRGELRLIASSASPRRESAGAARMSLSDVALREPGLEVVEADDAASWALWDAAVQRLDQPWRD